jgi:hypothetical protein
MTGSPLAPVIIAIVSVISLTLWLAMVFYADAHPGYAESDAMAEHGSASEISSKHGREQNDRAESISSGNRGSARESRDAAQPGDEVTKTGPLPERPAA